MKKLIAWRFELRKWQKQAAKLVKERWENGEKDFLCVATPGAGKTIFALRMVHYLLRHRMVQRVVILCPTDHLKKQWAASAARFGIDIDPYFENSMGRETSDFWGVVLTYAQVGRAPIIHRSNTLAKKTLAVFDEIHHLGDDLTWGNAIRMAFDEADYRLAISGTPFRRDTNPIPFVNYEDGRSNSDYVYGYQHAIVDKVCRPVYFPAFDGEMKWRSGGKEIIAKFSDPLSKDLASERLRTALEPDGRWLKTVIADADATLNGIRNGEHKDAGGLVITMDQTHARRVSYEIERITGEKPVVVVSEDPKASNKIKEFAVGKSKWIIAVKMISEGVDIPRLRVGIFATNVKSELFFRQAVGRFVRMMQGLTEQQAYFYIPRDSVLVHFAKQIETERDHAIVRDEDDEEEFFEDQIELLFKDEDEEDKKHFEAISSEALDRVQYELDFGKGFEPPPENSGDDDQKGDMDDDEDDWVVEEKEEDLPVYELVAKLKEDIKEIARIVAKRKQSRRKNIDWELPHKEWRKMGGKPIDMESIDELKQRRNWLMSQLH